MAVTERAQRRDELLDLAATLFSEGGYHGTSMQDLADSMGILRGSLYSHIDSKEELLHDIVDRGADRFITRLEEVIASDAEPEGKIRSAVRTHVTTVTEHTAASIVFLNEWRFLSDDKRESILAKRDYYEALVRELIEEGIEWGTCDEELDPKFGALFFLSTVNWLHQWYDSAGPMTPEEISDDLADLILHGLKGAR